MHPLVTRLVVDGAIGIMLGVLLEALGPVFRQMGRIWWIESMGKAIGHAPAVWLLLPAWLLAVMSLAWERASGSRDLVAGTAFVVFPALAVALTFWKLRHRAPTWWRRGQQSRRQKG